MRLTQATLVRINRSTDRVEPWLAESWTASADNLTYVFKLRPNVQWSDGTPLAQADILASLATIELSAFLPGDARKLEARALDPQTIEIRFPAPFAPGLRMLDAHPILPRHKTADAVGLGPFLPARAESKSGRRPQARAQSSLLADRARRRPSSLSG